MSSMTKVMQKIQGPGRAPDPPEVELDTTVVPPDPAGAARSDADVDVQVPMAVPVAEQPDTASAFVPEVAPPAAPVNVAPGAAPRVAEVQPLGRDIQPWDPQRVDRAVVAFHDRYSAICEQYRSVRARLLTMNSARKPHVIAISSAIPQEGKSVSAVNVGLIMAEGGEHRILIVDADFRRSSLARMLGVANSPGLADALRGEVALAEAWQATPFPNLRFLPAGQVHANAFAELLGGPAAKRVLEQFRAAFDYVFVDTPSITTVSDVSLLAPHCDGVIVVIEARRTPEPTVQQAVRTLQANNVKILGTLLSRFRERDAGYYDDHSFHNSR